MPNDGPLHSVTSTYAQQKPLSRQAECRLVAQMRSADRAQKCLLFGGDRTYREHHETDAFDPERTSRRCADSHTDDAGGRGNLLLKI